MTPDEASLVRCIADGDRTARYAYADWLRERGREAAAEFWAWAAEVGLRTWTRIAWCREGGWWRGAKDFCGPTCGDLPASVWDALRGGRVRHGMMWEYETPAEAYLDLAQAADRYRPEPVNA